jgi:hypothetical protein
MVDGKENLNPRERKTWTQGSQIQSARNLGGSSMPVWNPGLD